MKSTDKATEVSAQTTRTKFDDVPGVVAPRGRAEAEPPRDMETAADFADGAVNDLELLGTAEPALEVVGDLRCALELREPGR